MTWYEYVFMSVNIYIHVYLNQFFEDSKIHEAKKLGDTTVVFSENKSSCCPQPPIPSPRSNCLFQFL